MKRTNALLTDTLAGSICKTFAILSKKSDRTAMKWMNQLKVEVKSKSPTIKEICDIVNEWAKVNDDLLKYIILVYDEKQLLTPLVTIQVKDVVYPLSKTGSYGFGVLGRLSRDYIKIEHIYDTEEN